MFRRIVGFVFFLFLVGAVIGGLIVAGLAAFNGTDRWLVVGLMVLILIGFGMTARRMFGRSWAPVGDLIDATRRLGEGETGVRINTRVPGPFRAVMSSFNRMSARLEEEDERRRRLLADLGHELRTPLTVIRGEIEAVLDGLHDPQDLSHVIDEVDLMERLLEDLRVLALAEAGRLQLHKEPTDMEALIGEVANSFASTVEGRGVVIEVDFQPDMSEVEVDPHRLHQVLSNLVSNAINHLDAGGAVTVKVRQEPEAVVLEVADTGPGIPEDQLEHIFERFVKAGDSAGTGLGLSIAKDLVEAHGATITAANHPQGGAVFTVRLPVGR
ncbi:MAG: HAMP domain-containing sensor histidine kinase [Acidimicrobiia bacterium]